MIHGKPVIDADGHKCENPILLFDYIERPYRDRIKVLRDRFGEQRFCFRDFNPSTKQNDLERVYLQPEGLGKGTFRPYHEETTLGGLFNRRRIEHMDREGIDLAVVYGSISLAYGSILDPELAVALCRAYNDYIAEDCQDYSERLFPIGVLPLQDPQETVKELRRCIGDLGMVGASVPPQLTVPHPDAPDCFPRIRFPKPLSHPDFHALFDEAERLDVALGIHGAPGMYFAAGTADLFDTFTLVHAFANRNLQQMAMSKLIFDGTLERFPRLRFGFLEAGCGWLPDFIHNLQHHWETRVVGLRADLEPSATEFLLEMARERRHGTHFLRKTKNLLSMLFTPTEDEASPHELEAFLHEHPMLARGPRYYLERGQIFVTTEPDDPAPVYLPQALGDVASRVVCWATDYGHWDACLKNCVGLVRDNPAIEREHAIRLLSQNALDFYGPRLSAKLATTW